MREGEEAGKMGGCRGRGESGKQTDAMQMWSLRDQAPMNCLSRREKRKRRKQKGGQEKHDGRNSLSKTICSSERERLFSANESSCSLFCSIVSCFSLLLKQFIGAWSRRDHICMASVCFPLSPLPLQLSIFPASSPSLEKPSHSWVDAYCAQ